MNWQAAVVIIIVGVSAVYLILKFVIRSRNKETCGCNCAFCPSANDGSQKPGECAVSLKQNGAR